MCILLKDLVKNGDGRKMSKAWLNRLVKDYDHDAYPAERGEHDREMERPKGEDVKPFLPRRGKG